MPDSVIFTIAGFAVRWYGIMIMLGVVAATLVAYSEAKRRGQDGDTVWALLPWILVTGILGARLGWVISEAGNHTFTDLFSLFFSTGGSGIGIRGLSIQGGLVGGVLAGLIYTWRKKMSFLTWADIIVPGLALAQAIGRWGNYFNQEAFGRPTDLPWGIPISVSQQIAVAGPNAGFTPSPDLRFHPTFAYEMIWDLGNFGLLMWLGRQKRFKLLEGDLLWVYLVVYSVGRYFIEAIRVDSATLSGFKTPQLFALATIALAVIIFALRHRRGSTARPATTAENSAPAPAAPTESEPATISTAP